MDKLTVEGRVLQSMIEHVGRANAALQDYFNGDYDNLGMEENYHRREIAIGALILAHGYVHQMMTLKGAFDTESEGGE